MTNPLKLIAGQSYRVIQSFTDYDRRVHPIGEKWTFVKTNFVPYDDGLTLHVLKDNTSVEVIYRLQWTPEEQAEIIQHFSAFVEQC